MKKIILNLFLVFTSVAFAQQKPDALKMYISGNYKEAIEVCEQELSEFPDRTDSYVVLCWSLVASKQYQKAEKYASDGLFISPNDLRLVEVSGEAKFYLGKNKEALSLFERYLAGIPDTGSRVGIAYYYVGEIYIRLAKYNHADIALTAAVTKEPLLDYWWTRLGYAREMAKSYKGASIAYYNALKLNPYQQDATSGQKRVSQYL